MSKGITFWQLLQGNDVMLVSVPVIQRDYAQGRKSKKAKNVREKFLRDLADHLKSGDPLGLDFVYGSMDSTKKVELIDGQQRFTTLFLLHLYFAIKDTQLSTNKETLIKFSYEVRDSAKEFCRSLIENGHKIELSDTKKLSEDILDAVWFSDQWKLDPTVEGMLSMLDDIHSNKYFRTTEGIFAKLCSEDCPVTFQFLSLEENEDCEDLYIKMNARGKALTDFENFKALFGKWLEKKNEPLASVFWKNIDGEWSSVFWNFVSQKYKDHTIAAKDWVYRVDLTMLSYLWQQVLTVVHVLNASKKELPFFSKNNVPEVDFSLIEDPSSQEENQEVNTSGTDNTPKFVDWSGDCRVGKLTPEALLVGSLEHAEDILKLIERIFVGENAPVTLWRSGAVDIALFPVELATDTQSVQVIKTPGASLRDRLLCIALIYWCCVVEEIPKEGSEAENRLIDYLRTVRNFLEHYHAYKKGIWDPQVDQKNFGVVVKNVLEIMDPTRDCDDRLLDKATLPTSAYLDEECEKADYRRKDPAIANSIRKMEDSDICKGSIRIFMDNGKPILSDDYFAEIMSFIKEYPQKLSIAMLACAQDGGGYFRFLAGESPNSCRVKFAADKGNWAVGLQYNNIKEVFDNNKVAIKALAAQYAALRDSGKERVKALDEIIETFIAECEANKKFGWRYYMIKYQEGFFAKKTICFSGSEKELSEMPLMEFMSSDPFSCKTAAVMRFRDDSSVNSFILCAVYEWYKRQGKTPDNTFVAGGKQSTLQSNTESKTLEYDNGTSSFCIKTETAIHRVEVKENENLIETLIAAFG